MGKNTGYEKPGATERDSGAVNQPLVFEVNSEEHLAILLIKNISSREGSS